jgi:carboxyl-terminal processing protease
VQREYREVTERSYYRLAAAERDTVGRPSCRTARGRVVYGGGGIYPDVVLPPRPPRPLWLARIHEESLPLKWIGGYLSENPAVLTTAEALAGRPALPAEAVTAFRNFARRHGIEIPDGAEADSSLQQALVLRAAAARWGAEGYFRVAAVLDPDVSAAADAFPVAEQVLAHDGE